jgi:hypothetical protein
MTIDEIWISVIREIRRNPDKKFVVPYKFFDKHRVRPLHFFMLATPDLRVEPTPTGIYVALKEVDPRGRPTILGGAEIEAIEGPR